MTGTESTGCSTRGYTRLYKDRAMLEEKWIGLAKSQ
jgi:hypothetical protein